MEFVGQLLERTGLVTRESIDGERISGGFSSIYPVLKALEDAGRVRRGYFVEGLGGAQFAAPGADERLRHLATESDSARDHAVILSAVDPASPYGAVIPWPETSCSESSRPKRAAGARVILRDGNLLGYLNPACDALTTFRCSAAEPEAQADQLATAIADAASVSVPVLLKTIDGIPAEQSPLAPAFVRQGFQASSSGLRHRGL